MRESVLVPTGRKMKSYGCLRSLGRRGIHTIVASEHDRIPHFSSRFCSERVPLPSGPEQLDRYKDALLEVAKRQDVMTIVPVRECDVYMLAKYREEFTDFVSLATPTLETLEKAHDRVTLAREAESAGIPTLETQLLSEVDTWSEPAVVKPRYNILTGEYLDSHPSDAVEEVKHVQFLRAGEMPDTEAIREKMGHEPIVQEFVPQRRKHLYCALWDHGEPLAAYQHEQLRQNSWVGGGGVYRSSTHCEEVDRIATDLLERLDWHGFACIEFVEHEETGEWLFLEINPRIWQSLPEAVRAGADFPYYYWLQTQGRADEIDLEYADGIVCHNAYGELAHLQSVLHDESPFVERPSFTRTLGEIAGSCVRHPRFEYLRLDDPGLFLSALKDTFSSGITDSREYINGDVRTYEGPPNVDQ